MKYLIIPMLTLICVSSLWAFDIPSRQNSCQDIQQKLCSFFDKMSQESPYQSPDVLEAKALAHYGHKEPGANYYREAINDKDSPYKKSKTLETLYKLGEIAAASVGTSQASVQSNSLRERAAILTQTGDPEFTKVADYYQQEATAIDNGDYNGARDDALKINAIPRADISNYNPTSQEKSFTDRLGAVAGNMLQSVASSAGTFALTTLLGAIGGPIGAIAGQMLGPALTQVLTSLLGGNTQNTTEQILQNTGDQYANALQQRLQQWAQQSMSGKFSNSTNNFSNSSNNLSNSQTQFSVDQTLQQSQQKSLEQIKDGNSVVAPGGVLPK